MTRKLEELIYTVWLEQRFAKNEILELYLNRVYLGGGTYGVEAAARRYFGRSARDVTLAQSAVLAGLLKAPSRYAPTRSIKAASARAQVVLDNMVDAGFITAAEAQKAGQQPLTPPSQRAMRPGYPYAVDWVAAHAARICRPTTTMRSWCKRRSMQSCSGCRKNACASCWMGKGRKLSAGEGAVVVLDPKSPARCGRSWAGAPTRTVPYDRALKARRQPGSAFKPFVYLAALEAGYGAELGRDRRAGQYPRLDALELHQHLQGPGLAPLRPRPFHQHGGGETHRQYRPGPRRPDGPASW